MIIIAGHSRAKDVDVRDKAVAAFADMIGRARTQEGCIEFSISSDPLEADRINLFECWRDETSLKAWRKVAKGPRVSLSGSVVKLYRADKAEKPF